MKITESVVVDYPLTRPVHTSHVQDVALSPPLAACNQQNIHYGVEVTELSTNKQHTLSQNQSIKVMQYRSYFNDAISFLYLK